MCRDADVAAAADVDDDVITQPCYRQRVTYDVLCLSEEPDLKYRTVQNVTGSDNTSLYNSISFIVCISLTTARHVGPKTLKEFSLRKLERR